MNGMGENVSEKGMIGNQVGGESREGVVGSSLLRTSDVIITLGRQESRG